MTGRGREKAINRKTTDRQIIAQKQRKREGKIDGGDKIVTNFVSRKANNLTDQ